MERLTLRLDDLAVDSFPTTAPAAARGTVFGEQCTCYTNCTCPGCPTCDDTCAETCGDSCGPSTCAQTCGEATFDRTCLMSCNGYDTCI